MVGFINTAVDFTMLNILISLVGLHLLFANILSTSVAMAVSFMLNKNLVFKNNEPFSLQKLGLFLVVTMTNLWIVQSVVIFLITQQFPEFLLTIAHTLSSSQSGEELITNNGAKVVATIFSLALNYYFYKKIVFKKSCSEYPNGWSQDYEPQ